MDPGPDLASAFPFSNSGKAAPSWCHRARAFSANCDASIPFSPKSKPAHKRTVGSISADGSCRTRNAPACLWHFASEPTRLISATQRRTSYGEVRPTVGSQWPRLPSPAAPFPHSLQRTFAKNITISAPFLTHARSISQPNRYFPVQMQSIGQHTQQYCVWIPNNKGFCHSTSLSTALHIEQLSWPWNT